MVTAPPHGLPGAGHTLPATRMQPLERRTPNAERRTGRWLWLVAAGAILPAAEVILDLPDPLVPNVPVSAELRVIDAPAAVTNLVFPSVPGLSVEIAEGGSMQTQIVNGKATVVRGIPLVVIARQQGSMHVPPVTVRLQNGGSIQSKAVDVAVQPGNPNLTGEAYAEAAFEPASIVPGQPAKLVYRIYLQRGSVETIGIEPPAGSISLGEKQVVRGRTFDAQGAQWTVFTVSWPFTVATPGEYKVEGQQDYQVAVGNGFFDTRVMRGRVAVRPAALTVEALPAEGRPDDFAGLIGPLALSGELDRPRLSLGEGVELRLTVTGRQVDLVKVPTPPMPSGVTAYPKADGPNPVKGSRTFRWDVVPTAPGEVTIPAVSVPYFDPETRLYRRAASQPLVLTVLPGRNRELAANAAAPVTASATAAAQPATAAPSKPVAVSETLPPPLRGNAGVPPDPLLPILAGGVCMASGVLLALIRRILDRRPGPHRGKALARALRRGDLDAAALALSTLQPSLTGEPKTVAETLSAAIDHARFGGQPLPDPTPHLRHLEGIP